MTYQTHKTIEQHKANFTELYRRWIRGNNTKTDRDKFTNYRIDFREQYPQFWDYTNSEEFTQKLYLSVTGKTTENGWIHPKGGQRL